MLRKYYFNTKNIVFLAVLSAIGTILMFIEIPTFTSWLKFDLSDLVVYIAAIIFGPFAAIIVAFIKSLLHFFLTGGTMGVPIGEFVAFVSSIAYVIPFYYSWRLLQKLIAKNQLFKIIPVVIGTLSLALIMTTLNYFYFTPWFFKLLNIPLPDNYLNFIVVSYIPFNLLKGSVLSVGFILISLRLEKIVEVLNIYDKENKLLD